MKKLALMLLLLVGMTLSFAAIALVMLFALEVVTSIDEVADLITGKMPGAESTLIKTDELEQVQDALLLLQQHKKEIEQDVQDLQSQKDENAPELATPQAVSDAQVENQVWEENEGENSGVSDSLNSGQDYYQQDNSWNYESEGSVELMSLVEPPPLPDLDDR